MKDTTSNYERIRSKLSDLLSNDASRAAMTKRLCDEANGDPILTQDIAFKYSTTIKKRESETRGEDLTSKATLSTNKIKNHYKLPLSHQGFVSFRERVNNKCKDAIQSTYGEFNTITSPLLSFTEGN